MNPSTITYLALAFAVFSLLVGLVLLWVSMRNQSYFSSLNPMSWALIGLFPVFLIFALFPATSVSGTIFGVSMTGAAALFLLIWKYGVQWTKEAYESRLQAQLVECQKEVESLQTQLKGTDVARVPVPFLESSTHSYALVKASNRKIGLVTGSIENVTWADIWVSSENTNMEMARYFDLSVSATIRYLGSKKNAAGDVIEDVVGDELEATLIATGSRKRGQVTNVQPATVMVTGAGELTTSNNVSKIFHVAAVRGQFSDGYRPIPQIESCVTKALKKTEEPDYLACKSILFPLLGTGTARADRKETAKRLLVAAISYLETSQKTTIETVYFVTRSDVELEACQEILAALNDRVTRD